MTFAPPTDGSDLFTSAARRIVDYLNRTTPLKDWSVTRVTGGEQVHLHVHAEHVIEAGVRHDWEDGFCHRMVAGATPVVIDTQADPDYADLEHSRDIRGYAGVPLTDDTGELFGVLCGFGTEPLDSIDDVDIDLITLMSDLLSTQLVSSRAADRGRRDVEIAEALAQTDALTGLTNRRGWDALASDAEQRLNAYGDLVAVAVIDLDGLKATNDRDGHAEGDRLLVAAATALASAAHRNDRVARYGGDEFAILANNVAVTDLPAHFADFTDALSDAGIEASLGLAVASPSTRSVVQAFAEADAAMYAIKSERKADAR